MPWRRTGTAVKARCANRLQHLPGPFTQRAIITREGPHSHSKRGLTVTARARTQSIAARRTIRARRLCGDGETQLEKATPEEGARWQPYRTTAGSGTAPSASATTEHMAPHPVAAPHSVTDAPLSPDPPSILAPVFPVTYVCITIIV